MEGFEAWVTYLFDRPPGRKAATWWDEHPSEWIDRYGRNDTPKAEAERTRHLFSNAGAILSPYSDDQVGQGLIDIVDSGGLYNFTGLRSIVTLFAEIFAPRVLVDNQKQMPKLEYICFMFFDVSSLDLEDDAVQDVLESILALKSIPCQRAALHGLGHAHFKVPQQVQGTVDRWLKEHPNAPQELRDYAKAARNGHVM